MKCFKVWFVLNNTFNILLKRQLGLKLDKNETEN